MIHAAGRAPATGAVGRTATERRGRRHQEVAFGRGPRRGRRCGTAERHVAKARGGRSAGMTPFVGRREQAARPALFDSGYHERAARAAAAAVTAERRSSRYARQPSFGHGGGRGRRHRHRQHRSAGARGPALVLHQRLDVGRGFGLARPTGHQSAMARGRAARPRERSAAREHGVLPRPDLQRPVSRLDRLENGRRLDAAVDVELGKRRPVLESENPRDQR